MATDFFGIPNQVACPNSVKLGLEQCCAGCAYPVSDAAAKEANGRTWSNERVTAEAPSPMQGFDQVLMDASQGVSGAYFQLPVAGQEDPIYRERVYCYELYHQLRLRWPQETAYSLAGEIDKSGHPLVRENGLDRVKPDLLVHIPGNMGGNYAVIEVKPVNANRDGLTKDLRTLNAFRLHAGYERSLLLVYGGGDQPNSVLHRVYAAALTQPIPIPLDNVEVWLHATSGHPAYRIL